MIDKLNSKMFAKQRNTIIPRTMKAITTSLILNLAEINPLNESMITVNGLSLKTDSNNMISTKLSL